MTDKVDTAAPAQIQSELPPYAVAVDSGFTRNNKIFAVGVFSLQVFLIIMFAIFIRPTPFVNYVYGTTTYDGLDNGLVTAVGAGLLVLVGTSINILGFGLYFSYLKNMIWSGLGFTFLITVIVFQYYFVVNGFWTKANVQVAGSNNFAYTYIQTYLSN